MLQVHLSDGQTLCYDLADSHQMANWAACVRDPAFQAQITGLTIQDKGVQYSLSRPEGFVDGTFCQVEVVPPDLPKKIKGGQRIMCQAGDVRITIMIHAGQRAARVTVARVGVQRYNPFR